jgi:predicted AlkP superfamily pyrophosphatase or phosphodiesterase
MARRSRWKTALWILLGLMALDAVWLAYTGRPPYELPTFDEPPAPEEFVATVPRRPGDRSVIVLLFDGFAPAAVEAADTPSLDRMAREGAHTHDMMPVFPSTSRPNHVSLSTGCYPERHGMISNHFRDPERGFSIGVTSSGWPVSRVNPDWLLACELLHVVAERQGVRSAVFGGFGLSSHGRKLASVALQSDGQLVERVVAQLERPADERPGLITGYYGQPDHTAHQYGPRAPQTLEVAHALDAQIGQIMDAIERLGLRDRVTLIVTTDHGMVEIHSIVSVERLLRQAGVPALVLGDGSIANVYLENPADKSRAAAALSAQSVLDVIDRENPPAYARFGRSARVGDLVVSVHPGYDAHDTWIWPWYLRWASFVGSGIYPITTFKGMHGYDPETVPEVRAIFYAWGAEIRDGADAAGMRTVDVHPTVTHLLSIEPGQPVDGQARTEWIVR